jgi:hypothetical protein
MSVAGGRGPMSAPQTSARPPVTVRRTGHALVALADAVLLWLIHIWPGWEVVPFLTSDMSMVLGMLDAALVAGVLVQLALFVRDDGWLPPAGLVVTSAVGLALTVRVLQVFRFDFDTASHWDLVVRVLLLVGIVGSAIGLLAAVVSLLRVVSGQGIGPATP